MRISYKYIVRSALIITIASSTFLLACSKKTSTLLSQIKEGGYVIYFRHAQTVRDYADQADPNMRLNDCNTQRNLNEQGINQSYTIGAIFHKNQIPIDRVLSSQWCRCLDTAKFAFKNFESWNALNSTFSEPFRKNHNEQISELREFLTHWDDSKGNLILITHYVIIEGALNYYSSSGEIVITNKYLEVLGNIKTKY